MKVRDLIKNLLDFDPNLPVVGTWEGTIREIETYSGFAVLPDEWLSEHGKKPVVFIDADHCYYKKHFQNHEESIHVSRTK
jgi:hypothetical protein